MILTRAQGKLLPLLVAVSVMATGCGSVNKLLGGKKGKAAAQRPQSSTSQLITSFTVRANPTTGEFIIEPAPATGASLPGRVRQQATPYTRAYDLQLTGRATYNTTTHVLSGDVTLSSTNSTTFHNMKVIVTSISATDVTVRNADGVTDLTGANKPYWSFGDIAENGSSLRNWEFNVPAGVSFSFALAVYADVWSTPPGDGGAIMAMHFLDTRGWAVGQGGKILYTSDGGLTWSAQTSNVSTDLRDVFFINGEQGWIVGTTGTILATTNGGKTWRRQFHEFPDYQLNGVAFLSPSTGFAVGINGLILMTQDGGNTWFGGFEPNAFEDELYAVSAAGGRACAVGAAGLILVYDVNNPSWEKRELPINELPFPQIGLNGVFGVNFIDSNRGWIVGVAGLLFRTTNGGITWERLHLTDVSGTPPNLSDVKFVSGTHGWVTGLGIAGGRVYRTSDGGNTWNEEAIPSFSNLHAVAATNPQNAWVAGDGGIVHLTQNGASPSGGNWFTFTGGTGSTLTDVHFASRTTGFAVGLSGTLLRTTDGGRSWQRLESAPFGSLNAVHFVSESVGWIVGANGWIFKTINGGASWDWQDSGTSLTLNSIYMLDENRGWAVGQEGTMVYTEDGGEQWLLRPVATNRGAFNRVRFSPDGTRGYAVTSNGLLFQTSDGQFWEPGAFTGSTQAMFGIATAPGGHVWICGARGVVQKLNEDGFSWTPQDPGFGGPTQIALRDVHFVDALRGYLVGSSGTLLKTTDGGATWTPVEAGTTRELRSVDFFDEDTGAMVGVGGSIKTFR